MRFFLKFFAAVMVILLIGFGIFYIRVHGSGFGERLEQNLQAQSIDRNRGGGAPVPTTQAPVRVNYEVVAGQAAQMAGVRLARFSDYTSHQEVILTWGGTNNQKGADFLDALIRLGHLRDFEESSPPQTTKDRRGETEYRVSYRLYMR